MVPISDLIVLQFPVQISMTLRPPVSPILRKRDKKRKRSVSLKYAMRLTYNLIKKFRNMKLIKNDEPNLPLKKRKLHDTLNENSVDCFMVDFSWNSEDNNCVNQDVSREEIASCPEISSKSKNNKRVSFLKKAQKLKKSAINLKQNLDTKNLQVPHQLLSLFQNSINFIQPTGYSAIEDIDFVVRQFSMFGKVTNIQNHWIKPRGAPYPVWAGALVTYKTVEEFNCTLNGFSVKQSSIICVAVADHLTRIHHIESRWKSLFADFKNDSGTCILVEGVTPRASRAKLRVEFANYGTILDIRWTDGSRLKTCHVTYKTTVEAVAAAIALDGKSVHRCLLKTKIKATAKECYIHRYLCNCF